MFESLSRSWKFATTSYKVIWNNKRLLVFPLLSTLAAVLVIASFAVPLWATGQLDRWMEAAEGEQDPAQQAGLIVTLFLFYFCNYFVIVFFNSALIASTMQVLNNEDPTIEHGLAVAGRRLPQIFGWALVSAFVGVALRLIENSNKRAGQFVASILGMAWTAMTFFVVPAIVLEGVGPVEAFKRSLGTLKRTWGTALVGNFSLGFLGFLLMIPVYLLGGVLIVLGISSGAIPVMVLCIAAGVALFVLGAATTSAAGTVFTALLYSYATGRTVPADVDVSEFNRAFVAKE